MVVVSVTRSLRLFLMVVLTLRGFFQPGHPLVPLHHPKLGSPIEDNPAREFSDTSIEGTSDNIIFNESPPDSYCYDSLFRDGRRKCLAQIMAMAPTLWLLPEIAIASSSSSSNDETRSSNNNNKKTPKDRPVNFELSAAVQKLFDLDKPNRLVPGKDYAIDVQNQASSKKKIDDNNKNSPLFQYVNRAVLEDRPTYRSFVALLDNYEPNVCLAEDNTQDETKEAFAFLKACMATPVLKFCYNYCRSNMAVREEASGEKKKKYSFETEDDFVQLLYDIWFRLYSRSKGCGDENLETEKEDKRPRSNKVYGSSGFEHVFVGEIRSSKVIGLHNWIQLYRQELAGNLDFQGTRRSTGPNTRVLSYNVRWKGAEKPLGTSLIGVSPEFELALYTMVFLVGNSTTGDNILLLNLGDGTNNSNSNVPNNAPSTKLDVKCFRSNGRVGSCYVEALS